MTKYSQVKVRNSQLIHTFGVGAMHVNRNGISMITCGLEHWYELTEDENGDSQDLGKNFGFHDARLQNKLGVKGFRTPPSYKVQNKRLSIAAKRFPLWHICSNTSCQKLTKSNDFNETLVTCHSCGWPAYQSRFISICEAGHIMDFPWFDWLNFSNGSQCDESKCVIQLVGTGSSSVADIKVKCCSCNSVAVSLGDIFSDSLGPNGELISGLSKRSICCKGEKPWLGDGAKEKCEYPPIAALRQSSNVYFARTESSVQLPSRASDKFQSIEIAIDQLTDLQKATLFSPNTPTTSKIDIAYATLNGEFSKEELSMFFDADDEGDVVADDSEFRLDEYRHFLKTQSDLVLSTCKQQLTSYDSWVSRFFSNISLIDKLTVTQALYGIDRVNASEKKTIAQYKAQLWLDTSKVNEWLPAVQIHGEGIFIEFSEKRLREWEKEYSNLSKFKLLSEKATDKPHLSQWTPLSPKFLLIHSFAHLLINSLINECGYSTASLRERLYVSDDENNSMSGVLIYTASGDTEGSLGGLVRMGRAGKLEKVISKAVSNAQWCSSDPICLETSEKGGQGPEGLNLAACHDCLLLPETSCEVFNCLLDRKTISNEGHKNKGYFDEW